ncbi:hypothetical protein B296_00030617 [Ensete ventricosum]|uniref:Uncharacterized protein n=1 Tax=Ensete ventricosum TaxID=4639 RepID=A0A426ZMW2_ENSVE|nr:hypothetical protein B296_00030617 [Ensete ventricosum]
MSYSWGWGFWSEWTTQSHGGGELPRKRSKVAVSKHLTSVVGRSFEKSHRNKGKEPTEDVEPTSHPFTLWELCEVDDRERKDQYFAARMSKLPQAKAEEPLKARWSNLTSLTWVWTDELVTAEYVLHFVGALIDRVHVTGRMIHLMHERNSTLRVVNKELKTGSSPEVVEATVKWVVELQSKVEWLKAELGTSKQQCKDLELAADSAHDKL